ncbi:MAG: ThiF family adenylyltransferase [Anaerolineae bacterium]|nr:ThiF family adenylyltransferase [Anaerolineae bacterium]
MKIKPVPRKSLPELVAGKLAAAIIDERFKSGSQLPPERELITQFEVSRASLREALKILSENKLIVARPGVGWFISDVSDSNIFKARELAKQEEWLNQQAQEKPIKVDSVSGPRRLPAAKEKPLRIPNLQTDRLGTFEFISWWERDKVLNAKVLVVGAGALGNEVVKNLALMGVGNIFILDFDKIEAANLSRSILFREHDSGRIKAEVVAARAKEINPNVKVQYLHGDVTTSLGLGIIRRMDVIIGCLDNREARLAVNRYAYWMNKPWVDGAIQELLGLARVFVPGEGACFECTLTDQARRDLAVRYSCPLLARQNVLMGKVPTTPTIASIIGAMQAQEALKVIHDMDVESGKVIHFNGLTNHMHTTAYVAKEDCESHWVYGEITELPLRAGTTTLGEFIHMVQADLGEDAILELDQELVLSLECSVCNKVENTLRPMSDVSFEAAHCPACGTMREVNMTHMITGDEEYLHRTLESIGVPPLHILRANNGVEYKFYELTGDLDETLHFSHFDEKESKKRKIKLAGRVKIGEKVTLDNSPANKSKRGRIKFQE